MRITALLWAAGLLAQMAPVERVPSPDGRLAVEYRDCRAVADCKAELRVTDAGGRIQNFLPAPAERFERVFWATAHRIGFVLAVSPSTTEYVEIDRESGRERKRLLGLGFVPARDGRIAHRGFLTHSAPPSANNETIEVDDTVLYPLPKGSKPVRREMHDGLPGPNPNQTDCRNAGEMVEVCRGIHAIHFSPVWSPNFDFLAFVESVSEVRETWSKATGSASTDFLNSTCQAVTLAMDGRFRTLTLPSMDCWQRKVKWADDRTVETDTGKKLTAP